jgi:hypothetical protein
MRRGTGWVTHVVQAVEAGDEIVLLAGVVLRQAHLKAGVGRYSMGLGVGLRLRDRTRMKIVADEP